MAARFNPPPGWDVPAGFSPEAGWQPDPVWPAPPPGWVWWAVDPPVEPRPSFIIPPPPVELDAGTSVPAPQTAPQAVRQRSRSRRIPVLIAAATTALVVLGAGGVWFVTHRGTGPTHDVTGSMLVSGFGNGDDGCLAGSPEWVLDQLNELVAGATIECPEGPGGGYNDIADGADVTVKDGAGDLLGVGALTGGTMTGGGTVFTFTVPGVPDVDFYQVEVSHRGAVTYTKDEMEAAGWVVSFSLG